MVMFELVETHRRDYFTWHARPLDSADCKEFEGTGWAFVHCAPWDTVWQPHFAVPIT
jgi:hypothetical protein